MAVLNEDGEVRAAGGVVVRRRGSQLEVLLVHRPKYDDWTFPKGKAEPREGDEQCALREVREETGLRCSLAEALPDITYVDREGRPKRVRYWLMEVREGVFEPHDEVDAVAWLPPEEAAARLTYGHDRTLLDHVPVT